MSYKHIRWYCKTKTGTTFASLFLCGQRNVRKGCEMKLKDCVDEIIKLRNEGYSSRGIESKLNLRQGSVKYIVTYYKLPKLKNDDVGTKSQRQMAKEHDITVSCLRQRLAKGWPLEKALTMPKYSTCKKGHGKLKKYVGDVKRLREEGFTAEQIAQRLNLKSSESVKSIVEHYGLPRITDKRNKLDEDDVKEKLNELGFEYLSGYERGNCESKVKVRCYECGEEFEYNYHNLLSSTKREGRVCCRKKAIEEERDEKKREELVNKQKRRLKSQTKKIKTITFYKVACKICGKEYLTTRSTSKCCCIECTKENFHLNYSKDRRTRYKGITIDKNITLKKLYRRDKGKCALCGGECDMDDYKVINGAIVCGNDYPSIDHIVPISKGGLHSWDNVQLAHRRCNSIKGNSTINAPCVGFDA